MLAAVILIFAATFLMIMGVSFAVITIRQSPAAELKRRLRRMEKTAQEVPFEDLAGGLLRKTTPFEQLIFNLPLLKTVKGKIERSGITVKSSRFILATVIISAAGCVAMYLLKGNLFASLLVAALLVLIPYIYLQYRKQQRETQFAEQLPDALVMVARSLRAGHSLTSAVELVSQELPDPAGGLFKIAYEQQHLGMRMAESLGTLREKIDSIDLHFFVTIVRINSDTGGNLAEILEKLAETIRSRLHIRRQIQVYTAEGRLSGYVLVLLPVVVFIAFYLKNPDYMRVFFTEQACKMSLIVAALAQVVGFLMIRKIIAIRI